MEPKTTGKRIVSKGEYVELMSRKAFLWMVGGILSVADVWLVIFATTKFCKDKSSVAGPILLFIVFILGFFISQVGKRLIKAAERTEIGVPLTRANTAHLPASESLVRASEEPMQAHEAVLLRAASEGQETPPEQMLRAAEGQEQP